MDRFNSNKLKQLREANRITQKQLGDLLGISDRAVSKWESELSKPSGKNLVSLAKIFNVTVESFFENSSIIKTKKENTIAGMESLTELYKIGRGPSSSHTIGPEKACLIFKSRNKDADRFKAILYGSLAKTGKGHCTDEVIRKTFSPYECEVEFNYIYDDIPHPNTMELISYKKNIEQDRIRVFSIGGGSIAFENDVYETPERIYKLDKFTSIASYCEEKNIRLWQYAVENEDEEFSDYMHKIWNAMKTAIKSGLVDTGELPGGLGIQKKAKSLFNNQHVDESPVTKENRIVCSYAFAVGEQNASGEKIVTAPTCGAAGIVPAVLYYQQQKNNFSDESIVRSLMTAGIIGNLIKTNASISGAECGCQAEVGSACAMAAAALGELFELSIDKIEYAAEIAIEHHLGLTCDPICGLVQIPCIERNAVAAMRAINAVNLASFLWNTRKISLDKVIQTMKETGYDMHKSYKETSEAGLAKIHI
ncbi:MAG: L-serine ammonia-lyase [Clostridia bacterium]|nr:L-serine ammonia-lyase [Clostridia bacterium]